MHRSVKIISVIVAACISLIYIGSFRVKAVSSAVLGLSGLIACIECLGSSIIGSSSQIAVNSNSGVSLDDFGLGTSGGSASLTSDQLISYYFSSIDPSEVAGMSDQETFIYVTDPDRFDNYLSEYISSPVSIGVEYGCKSYLSEVHLAAEQGKVISDISGLVLSPSTFSDIVNSVSSDVISGITGNDATVSFENGLRHLTMTLSRTDFYPDLAAQYGAINVYRAFKKEYPPTFSDSFSSYFFLDDIPLSFRGTLYFVYVSSYNASVYSPFFSEAISLDFSELDFIPNSSKYFGSCYIYPWQLYNYRVDYGFSSVSGSSVDFFSIYESHTYLNTQALSSDLSFPFSALFQFSDIDHAKAFSDALASLSSDVYNPALDTDTGDDVITAEFPGTVPEAVADYYGGEKDIVVSPGAVIADDGTTTYDPSITIDGADVQDVADDPDFNEWMEQNKFVPALSNPDFELYDQCKNLLENLFNYNDVNTPPSFKFYYDSNNDGTSETYDVLDLSVLETTLSNDNMEDKSWWGTDIKVIDVIRYVIAAILYGLFIMRLIKRLPTFYGSGPWADM